MYLDKRILVSRIEAAVQTYKQYLVGKTFMFIYGNSKIEVIFKVESFMHLTGVASTLYPKDFYKKAERKTLRQTEIMFDSEHPADLADIKTQCLHKLYELTINDIFIADDIVTMTATFAFGLTNLEFVLCCGKNTDKNGKVMNECYVPYSFRIEEIGNEKFGDLYEVKYIFSKLTNKNKYSEITYGEQANLNLLNEEIKNKLDMELFADAIESRRTCKENDDGDYQKRKSGPDLAGGSADFCGQPGCGAFRPSLL